MVSLENRLEMLQAQLCARVDDPTPPFAPTKAMERPRGAASGSTKMVEITPMTSAIETGATMYSETPLRTSSR